MNRIWLVGTGNIAIEYAKVLNELHVDYIAIGRGRTNIERFIHITGHNAIEGGLDNYILSNPDIPSHAIVTVNVESLSSTTSALIKFGIRNILLEKPGVCEPDEILNLVKLEQEYNARVVLAYNRRFYASVLKAEEIIFEDKGITSFIFEFTEWAHKITPLFDGGKRFNYWFLSNSSHVVDLAFYLGGIPIKMSSYCNGSLEWHSSASVFSGAGITDKEALFSYHANWEAPGRWLIEICTKKHRLYFKPMETLQIQEIGSVVINPVNINDELDKKFKPGLYLQTETFLANDFKRFCSIKEQQLMINDFYKKMSNY